MKYFSLLFLSCVTILSSAQSDVFSIELQVLLIPDQKGVTVNLKSHSINRKLVTNAKGILEINSIKFGDVYELVLSKNKFVTKTIKIEAKKGYFEGESFNDVVAIEVEMIETQLYVDYDIVTNAPVGMIEIGPKTGRLENNEVFNTKRKNEIDFFLETAETLSIELQERLEKVLKRSKKLIEENELKLAEISIQEAEKIAINKDTKYVRESLEIANSRKGDEEVAISKIIKVADSLLAEENYKESLGLYKRVLRLDPENKYAQEKINEINVLLVNMEKKNDIVVDNKTSTSEILARAMRMQEKRIDGYYSR